MNRSILYLLILAAISVVSCRKSHSPEPKKERRLSVTGTVAPLFAVKDITVSATHAETGVITRVKPDAKGRYHFYDLPAGDYNITYLIGPQQTAAITADVALSSEPVTLAPVDFTGHPSIPLLRGTGSINGRISPGKMTGTLNAMNVTNRQSYQAAVDAGGFFVFEKLPAGKYACNIQVSGYKAVDRSGFEVDLADGQILTIAELRFKDLTDPGELNSITYDMDGVKNYRKTYFGCTFDAQAIHLFNYDKGFGKNGLDQFTMKEVQRLDIYLDGVTGPGSYELKGTATSGIRFTDYEKWGMGTWRPVKSWRVPAPGKGSVNITSIDPVARTISGTFSATLSPVTSNATGDKVITNGSFTNFKY